MDFIFETIEQWLKDVFISGIVSNFSGMFEEVNEKVVDISQQMGQTPQSFNSGVFSMVKNLSESVIVPIAGIILTFVVCYELIHIIIERNNMHDFDTYMIYKWIFKTFVAVYLLTHTFDIVMGVFELAQHVINGSSSIINGNLNIDLAMDNLETQLNEMGWGELLGLYFESLLLSLGMKIMSLCVFIIIYGRMIEIYLTISIAPIPFSTMINREWGQMGNNYLKSLFAIAFQGFLIMVCVAIYAVLLHTTTSSNNIHSAIWGCVGYTVLLCFALFKTGSLAKSVFSAH